MYARDWKWIFFSIYFILLKNSQTWILWGHIKYLLGDFKDAKEKYERVLLFPDLPSDQTHSIYIRLASIYLKEENVLFFFIIL